MKFTVYDYRDCYESGKEARIIRTIYPEESELAEDIQSLIDGGSLEENLEKAQAMERARFNEACRIADLWVDSAKKVSLLKMAIDYIKTTDKISKQIVRASTIGPLNTWYAEGDTIWCEKYKIMNKTFMMTFSVLDNLRVSWSFSVNPL